MKLVECVPNFSEGKDKSVIEAIAGAISAVEGVTLLDVDAGVDTNRTVMTFIGRPDAVSEAAFQAIRRAGELIDMRKHTGAHSRIGACDVCPFVPVREVSMKECVELARRLGERAAEELGLPVYLYEEAATRPERRNLADVRKGEYESLAARRGDPFWEPDFGSLEGCERTGATVVGAREFLIAYNFNLNTTDRKIAHDIALDIREAGRARRDDKGRIIRDNNGKAKKKPGKFKHVKAVGWLMEDFDCAQVTMNLTNYKKTPLAEVFDEVCAQAEKRGVRCTGSELVGLIPEDCLLAAGRHFLHKAQKSAGVPESDLMRLAIQSLGLSELYPFEVDKKVIENRIPDRRPLAGLKVSEFADELSRGSAAPGGGSVSALCGALAASLASMVGHLTAGKKGYARVTKSMQKMCEKAQPVKDRLLRAVDDDTAAFDEVMRAFALARKTDEQKTERKRAIQAAMKGATRVPLAVLEAVCESLDFIELAARKGNKNSLSDAGVAGLCARAAAEGAFYNVLINLADVDDEKFVKKNRKKAEELLERVAQRTELVASDIRTSLGEPLKSP